MDEQIKRLSELDIDNILIPGDPHFKINDVKKILQLLKVGAEKLLEYPEYWEELSPSAHEVITNEVRSIMRVIVFSNAMVYLNPGFHSDHRFNGLSIFSRL